MYDYNPYEGRDEILYKISQALASKSKSVYVKQYRSVKELRKDFPNIPKALNTTNKLRNFLSQILEKDLTEWQEKPRKKRTTKKGLKETKISLEEMRELKAQGKSLREIGKIAGISRTSVQKRLL